MNIALVGVIFALIVVIYLNERLAEKARHAQQGQFIVFIAKQQDEIRNLTASIVRSSGGAFILPQGEVRPTEKWFQGKVHVTPKT